MPDESVTLSGIAQASAGDAAAAARVAVDQSTGDGSRIQRALALVVGLSADLPRPACGRTEELWSTLASVAAVDLTLARVLEPHLDACTILAEAAEQDGLDERDWPAGATWGVYASEGGPGGLRAEADGDSWRLHGTKHWCSLADAVSHALVTARCGDRRRLFAVALSDSGVETQPTEWAARGLAEVRSPAVAFTDVEARPVGGPGWYLERPGFAWGGAGVAAIWFGAAVALARRLRRSARERTPDQVALQHLGGVDIALARARAVLVDAAAVADSGADADTSALVAQRVRQAVAETCEEVLMRVGHALGPGPLTGDGEHARRVADLTVYLRQHHAERDQARLGSTVLEAAMGAATDRSSEAWRWW